MESEVEYLSQTSDAVGVDTGQSLPLPGTEAYEVLPQFPKRTIWVTRLSVALDMQRSAS